MVRGNVSRLTIGPDGAVYNISSVDLNYGYHNFSSLKDFDLSLLPRPDQTLDEKLMSIWMTIFAVFGGTAALAFLVLSTIELAKTKAHKLLDIPEPPHLIITLVWFMIPDASWASAGLPQVAARSARLIVQAEIGVSLMVGLALMLLKLVLD
ncbi:hypothetical protein Slin15195_G043560 [Septoria linicola]|uniref:Uncharacterized protein n=1 Tax=Septoria linicola TaxID=215465 RepID=A0A9Q9AKF3_9PEZI|nr:hypothetical protein Slin15195_G043560 [Septoria linicola]